MSAGGDSADITASIDRISRDLRRKQQSVKDSIEYLNVEDIIVSRVPIVERDLDRILEKRDEFRNSVRDFLEDHGEHLETTAQTTWRTSITSLNNEVKSHARQIRNKVAEVCPPIRPLSEFEKAQLEIQMKQLNLMEAKASKEHNASALRKQEDSNTLSDIITKFPIESLSDADKCKDQDKWTYEGS